MLAKLGLIAEPFDYFGLVHFRPGPRFFDLVPFEHSRRVIELKHGPGGLRPAGISDSRSHCTLEISHSGTEVQFLGAANTETPSCTACGYACAGWSAMVAEWYDTPSTYVWSCPSCRTQWRPWQLDWHLTCGFGRCCIAVWHVHHGEATPSNELLSALQSLSGGPWRYFYYQL